VRAVADPGIRYSALDLNDKRSEWGPIWDCTLGINWFLNPNIEDPGELPCTWTAIHSAAQQRRGLA